MENINEDKEIKVEITEKRYVVEDKEPGKKRKNRLLKVLLKTIGWIIVIVIVVFLTLFLSSKIGEFDSIRDMMRFIYSQF